MTESMTTAQFAERTDLPDWRILLGRIQATYTAGSFAAAAGFLAQVAVAADESHHHPDLDLRPPGLVHIALWTAAVRGLTDADARLAARITALAREAGLSSAPTAARTVELGIDAMDIDLVRPFWKAVLGYEDEPPEPGGQEVALLDPARIGPPVWFQQMDAPRPQRNRIHFDVTVPDDVAEARVAAAIAAGGTLLTDLYARSFWVLADPEGNEACVCTWLDRE